MARKKPGLLYRQSQLRGLLGGSRSWTILWMLLATTRLLRRLFGHKEEVVFSERLGPGQTLVISAGEREPRVLPPGS